MTIRTPFIASVLLGILPASTPSDPLPSTALPVAQRTLPDSRQSMPGRGFTVTGLVQASDGTIWSGNDGRIRERDGSPYRPSLVQLDPVSWTIRREIALPYDSSVQGLAIVGSRLFFALPSQQAIGSISLTAGGRPRIELSMQFRPNGLSYDKRCGLLIVGSETERTLSFYSLKGKHRVRSMVLGYAPDQLLQTSQGLLVTTGINRQDGRILQIRDDGSIANQWIMRGADSIEGIIVRKHQIILANDAYYHGGRSDLNQILYFDRADFKELDKGKATPSPCR